MDKRGRNKKAQFFIVGAVILGIILLSSAAIWNASLNKDFSRKNFQELCQNYRQEIQQVARYAVAEGEGEKDAIEDFTSDFLAYTSKTSPGFGLLYVYGNKDSSTVYNYLGFPIKANGDIIQNGNSQTFSYDKIEITDTNNKINKQYELVQDNKFYFIALEEKEGERYVCE